MSIVNIWHLRKVAEASAKPCDICYKPTSVVFITPDNQDHFYVCQSHTKDRGFCSPTVDEAELLARKKKEEMDREIELIKKEYEEKKKKKKSKAKEDDNNNKGKKEEDKDQDKDKETDKKRNGDGDGDGKRSSVEDDKEGEKKIKAVKDAAGNVSSVPSTTEYIPRIYALQKAFYQKRLDRKRNAEIARRSQERLNALKNPSLFPSVPTGNLG